jgi:hypothetical protein
MTDLSAAFSPGGRLGQPFRSLIRTDTTNGYAAADFLLNRAGFVSKGGVAGPAACGGAMPTAQDDWKPARLSLNLGIRYEYIQPIYEVK